MHKLTGEQQQELYGWLAQAIPYPQLADLMQRHFGVVLTSPGITWHRKHHAGEIAALREKQARLDQRRERDREAKARQRAGGHQPHCATCLCFHLP